MAFYGLVGRIRAPQGYFLDLASEEIACSTGMLLTDKNVKTISVRYDIDELRDLERGELETVIRPEDFEDAILNIRVAIGNLPDTKMGQFVLMDACIALDKEGIDSKSVCEAYLAISESGKYTSLTDEAIEEMISITGVEPLYIYEFLVAVAEMQRRKLNFLYGRVRHKQWDGTVKLDQLFQGEHIPDPLPFSVPTATRDFGGQGPPAPDFRACKSLQRLSRGLWL